MNTRERLRRVSSRMWLAVVAGVGVHVVGFALFAVKPPEAVRSERRSLAIGLLPPTGGHQDPIMREHMILSDQKPLYLPTAQNAGTQSLPASARRQPGEVFELFGALMLFPPTKLEELVPPPSVAPQSTVADLLRGARGPGGSFGTVDPPVPAERAQEAWVVVRSLREGRDVLRLPIARGQAPFAAVDWDPVELTVAVDPAGMIGIPVVTKTSRVESIDGFLPRFLLKEIRLGERLAPGFYQVVVAH